MPKASEVYIEGLNGLLRDFNKLPKDATKELRTASKVIADKHMVPAWKNAAITYAGPWGGDIADSVRSGSDRLPKVMIGDNKKTFRGGATANAVRYPSDSGKKGNSFAPFTRTNWISKALTYKGDAVEEWGKAVDRTIGKWAL